MKVFISVDIEGIAGVSVPLQGREGNAEYERARRLMTAEASAAVRGATKGGASQVVVADSHGTMQNILPEQLDSRARLVFGSPRTYSVLAGLDAGYDALVLIGFHSAAGRVGVMSHTYNGLAFARIQIEGRLVGEAELFAGYAAELNVPLAVASGDDCLAEEVAAVFPHAETVVAKTCLGGWASNSLSPEGSCRRIEDAVATKLKHCRKDEVRPLRDSPFTIELEMTRQFFADVCCLLPEIDRLSATRISLRVESHAHAIRMIQALSYIVIGSSFERPARG